MNLKKILRKNKADRYIFILTVLFLVSLPISRFFICDTIIGQGSYYHIRIAEEIIKTGVPTYDKLSGSNYTFNPLHLLLAFFIYIAGTKATSIAFPFIFGIASLLLYLRILKKLHFDPASKMTASLLLVSSPIFLYTFSTINAFLLPVFFNLLGFYFFVRDDGRFLFFQESRLNFYISILIFSFIPFFGVFNILITIALLLAYSCFEKNKLKNFYFLTFILLLISLIYSTTLYPFFFQEKFTLTMGLLTNLIFQLGAKTGFRIFILLLSLIGFFKLWSDKNKRISIFIFLLLFFASLFLSNLLFYLNFLIAIPAACGLLTLLKMKWRVRLIKNLTLLILISGLLISSILSIAQFSTSSPDNQLINALLWLRSYSGGGRVLSHPSNSFWIQKIANKPTFADPTLQGSLFYANRFNITEQIFYSRNLEKTSFLLTDNNISYIFIDPEMKYGKVWTRQGHGLLFLLENSETFKKIYDHNDIEIWKLEDILG
jgi:hypothetical protein